MQKTTLSLETLTCPTCIQKIENSLSKTAGVEKAKVLFNSSKAKVDHDDSITGDQLAEVVENLGYEVQKIKTAEIA